MKYYASYFTRARRKGFLPGRCVVCGSPVSEAGARPHPASAAPLCSEPCRAQFGAELRVTVMLEVFGDPAAHEAQG